jgi:hypothetical protein
LNSSKHAKNPFEWVKDKRYKEKIDIVKFNYLVSYLANLNGLSEEEFKQFVYWCENNKRSIDEIREQPEKTSLDL